MRAGLCHFPVASATVPPFGCREMLLMCQRQADKAAQAVSSSPRAMVLCGPHMICHIRSVLVYHTGYSRIRLHTVRRTTSLTKKGHF